MKFIKRYLTFHLCAILGYCLLIVGLYYSDPFANFKLFLWISFTPNIVSFMIYLMVALIFWTFFPKVLAIEIVIHLLVKKIFKKNLSINIENKYYNIFFYIGLTLLFLEILPGTLIWVPIVIDRTIFQ